MHETEEWRPIPDTDGLYEISSWGRVRSWWGPYGPHLHATSSNGLRKGNYLIFQTHANGVSTNRRVHTEVCRAFHGERPEWAELVRHLDGNPLNNRADNLAWGTHKENCADKFGHGYKAWSKLSEEDVRAIRVSSGKAADLAKFYGVSKSLIHSVRSGKARSDVQ